jgi:hypothetical protein
MNNSGMSNSETTRASIPLEVMRDALLVAERVAAGQPVPPEVVRRVRERADRIRREVLEKHGILDIGVPAIRELRDGTDE